MKWKERGMVFMKMINKDYFKYLIKQNRRLLFLIWLIGFIVIPFLTLISSGYDSYILENYKSIIALMYGFVISFLAPIYLFSFLQKKKSTILYFSLPIKKESLFITTALFSLFATVVPVVIYYSIALLISFNKYPFLLGDFILSILIIIVYMICQQAFVTTITMLCQNTLDSFVANAAYVVAPLIIFACFFSYISGQANLIMMGYGNYTDSFSSIIHYISIPYNGLYELMYSRLDVNFADKKIIIYWVIMTFIFIFAAYKLFLKRNMEQSENRTKSIFIYPVLITAIIFSLMFVMYGEGFNEAKIIVYAFIFILYLIMYFFAVRKVYFTWKIPAVFIVFIICCVGFADVFNNTNGFGTLSEYPNIEEQASFTFTASSSKEISFHENKVTHFTIDSKNKNTISLFLEFHKELIDKKIISYWGKEISTDTITIDIYYFDTYHHQTDRTYIIDSDKNLEKFIEMYDKFLETVNSDNQYTCHHNEYLPSDDY